MRGADDGRHGCLTADSPSAVGAPPDAMRPRAGGMKRFAASNDYVSRVHDLIPGGAHTYAKGDDQYPADMAPVIERGTGCRVWDIAGNQYVESADVLRPTTPGH